MKAFLIVVGILLFINLLPIGAHILFDESGFRLKLVFGLLQFKLLPKKEKAPPLPKTQAETNSAEEPKEKKAEKPEKKEKVKEKEPKEKKPKEKKSLGALIETYLPWVRLAAKALSDLRWLPLIRRMDIRVTFGGDAGTAALNYGKACGIIGAGLAILRRNLRIRSYRIHPEAVDGEKGIRVSADAVITLTLGGLLCYLVKYAVRALSLYLKSKKPGKAVKNNEPSTV